MLTCQVRALLVAFESNRSDVFGTEIRPIEAHTRSRGFWRIVRSPYQVTPVAGVCGLAQITRDRHCSRAGARARFIRNEVPVRWDAFNAG